MSAGRLPAKLRAAFAEAHFERLAVLDLACGPGAHLAHFGPGSLGLDRSSEAVASARGLGLQAAWADLQQAGWSSGLGPFEAAWLCDCLVHLPDPDRCLVELHSLLQPGAPVLIVEWCLPEGRAAAALASRFPGAAAHFAHPEHLHRFTVAELSRRIQAAGLRLERVVPHGLPRALRSGPRALLNLVPPRTLIARVP